MISISKVAWNYQSAFHNITWMFWDPPGSQIPSWIVRAPASSDHVKRLNYALVTQQHKTLPGPFKDTDCCWLNGNVTSQSPYERFGPLCVLSVYPPSSLLRFLVMCCVWWPGSYVECPGLVMWLLIGWPLMGHCQDDSLHIWIRPMSSSVIIVYPKDHQISRTHIQHLLLNPLLVTNWQPKGRWG